MEDDYVCKSDILIPWEEIQEYYNDKLDYTLSLYGSVGSNWRPNMQLDTLELLGEIAKNGGMSKDKGPVLEILKVSIGQEIDSMVKCESADYMVFSTDVKVLGVDGTNVTVMERGFERTVDINDLLVLHPAVLAYLMI